MILGHVLDRDVKNSNQSINQSINRKMSERHAIWTKNKTRRRQCQLVVITVNHQRVSSAAK